MILLWLIVILIAAGGIAGVVGRRSKLAARWVSLAAVSADFVIALVLWVRYAGTFSLAGPPRLDRTVVSRLDPRIRRQLPSRHGRPQPAAADAHRLSRHRLRAASWTEIRKRVGFFHLNLLWILAGITGVFLALDLFLFYFFWELMLVPMYFLIAIWGHGRRVYAAMKFFLFTQLSGLLMLLAILALFFLHHGADGRVHIRLRAAARTRRCRRARRCG